MIYKLSEFCNYVTDKVDIKSIDVSQYISTENMLEGKKGITKIEKLPNVKRVTGFKKKDILVSNIRPYFKKIWFAEFDGGCSADVLVFRANDIVTSEFLFCLLLQDEFFDQMVLSSKGTKMPRGDKKAMMNLEFNIPNEIDQNTISQILFSIKQKIELNNQMIDTLEEMASTLFKRWFVDFEFPDENGNPYKSSGGKMIDSELGEIPEGWEVGKLSDYGTIVGGGTPSKKIEKYYENGVIPWITPKDLSELRTHFISKGKLNITDEALKKSSAKLLPKGTVLFSSRAPIGYMAIAKNELSTNQGFKSVVPNENMSSYFIFLWLKENLELIKNFGTGSTFKEVSGGTMKNIDVVIPNQSFITQFNSLIKPFFKLVETAETENSKLISIRDILLPKLLSGEIEV